MKPALVALLVLAGCADRASEPVAVVQPRAAQPDTPSPAVSRTPAWPDESGPELIARFQCARCHEMNDATASARDDCVECHRQIVQGTFDAPRSALRRWRPKVQPLDQTPSLRSAGERLRRDWIERFLLRPFDVRPGLVPSMPRLDLTAPQAAAIAQALTATAPAPPPSRPDSRLVERGRSVYRAHRCARCHAYGGSGEEPDDGAIGSRAARLAPDLRFVRERFVRARLGTWLRDPRTVDPDATMPGFDLSDQELSALQAFLLVSPLRPPEPSTVPTRLPVLSRPVRWAEVERRVFRRICWHCHSDPDFALGEGGPGNHGGFGFAARGVDLSSYEGVLAGGVNAQGEPVSILRDGPGGVSRLVQTLLARQREQAGLSATSVRGMPLGMPALSAEDVQLVETWIAQGRAR